MAEEGGKHHLQHLYPIEDHREPQVNDNIIQKQGVTTLRKEGIPEWQSMVVTPQGILNSDGSNNQPTLHQLGVDHSRHPLSYRVAIYRQLQENHPKYCRILRPVAYVHQVACAIPRPEFRRTGGVRTQQDTCNLVHAQCKTILIV